MIYSRMFPRSKRYATDFHYSRHYIYVLYNSQTYSEWETEEAMKFIKENDLPMSDMFYALKYVRISNRAVELDEQFQQIQDRLDKLRQEDIRMVSPPSGGDWDPKLNK